MRREQLIKRWFVLVGNESKTERAGGADGGFVGDPALACRKLDDKRLLVFDHYPAWPVLIDRRGATSNAGLNMVEKGSV